MQTIRETEFEKSILRLVEKDKCFIGLIITDGVKKFEISGSIADDVWQRLHDEVRKTNTKYFGFNGARERFLRFFPNGFHSTEYVKRERDYKIAAKSKLDAFVPLERAATGSGFGRHVLSVFEATNLLSPFQKVRLRAALRGPAADTFIRAAARFTMGETKPALVELEDALRPYLSARWTVVTYLPFLWRPDEHMFLKSEVTKDFAVRVGHRFASDYKARLDIAVYNSLLDLAASTKRELAELKPRDLIDIQSFIWVVKAYRD